jgi:hypothetical protein
MSGFVDSEAGLPRNVRFLRKPWQPDQMTRNILRAAEEFQAVYGARPSLGGID